MHVDVGKVHTVVDSTLDVCSVHNESTKKCQSFLISASNDEGKRKAVAKQEMTSERKVSARKQADTRRNSRAIDARITVYRSYRRAGWGRG